MEKRGQAEVLQITLLFELIAGILIAGILIYAVVTINDTSSLTEEYMNKDYGIVKNMLEGKPGDYNVLYQSGTLTIKDGEFKKTDSIQFKGDLAVKITKQNGEIKTEMTKK